MDYREAKEYFGQAGKRGSVFGLRTMHSLMERMENPQNACKMIHIAGTNGKGSVGTYLSSVLSEAGWQTGRFVSPAVFEDREMFQIQGQRIEYITEQEFAEGITKIREIVKQMEQEGENLPTVFEMQTALAFWFFEKRNCDVVILEAGLGGKEDSTNTVKNTEAAVFTPIGMDHMAVLGSTIEEIAKQKAGIIKEGAQVFSAPQKEEVVHVLKNECKKVNVLCQFVKEEEIEILHSNLEESRFIYKGEYYVTKMPGLYQILNAVTAICVLRENKRFPVTSEQIRAGICRAMWSGRFEVISKEPLTIADGAHNKEGAKALRESLEKLCSGLKFHAIMGIFADKEYEAVCQEVLPFCHRVTVVPAKGERSLRLEILAETAGKYCRDVQIGESLNLVYTEARKRTEPVLIFGTLSFLKELDRWRTFPIR